MGLSIKNSEVELIARELAERTGESLTETILHSLRERLERLKGRRKSLGLADQLNEIAIRCAKLPVIDTRSEDEILGYDSNGIPHNS